MGNCGGLDVVSGGSTSGCGRLERLAQPYGADAVTKYRRKRRKIAAEGICVC
ncbi:DEAD-box ATP-dependent RNA helicase 24-like [Pyrus ussuriensis x Pyrus communis]|uniref:DEAD-box ATP-dependent RNA helicase 24-like n=1 Tax=Pyrus ussuriensis x Pyrus communis TaxID=2448454 RepID=A0A5N5FUH6_9ROSA|nr:DEAD-box ATP-dependent RNA helicase 24-like [Pyrus ussuriensis x Pyrus communis]